MARQPKAHSEGWCWQCVSPTFTRLTHTFSMSHINESNTKCDTSCNNTTQPTHMISARSHNSIMSLSVSKRVSVSSAAQFLVAALL